MNVQTMTAMDGEDLLLLSIMGGPTVRHAVRTEMRRRERPAEWDAPMAEEQDYTPEMREAEPALV